MKMKIKNTILTKISRTPTKTMHNMVVNIQRETKREEEEVAIRSKEVMETIEEEEEEMMIGLEPINIEKSLNLKQMKKKNL